MSANDHDRLVMIKLLTAERALKIAGGLYGIAEMLKSAVVQFPVDQAELDIRRHQCEHVARMFEDACSQPELPGTAETALGKL